MCARLIICITTLAVIAGCSPEDATPRANEPLTTHTAKPAAARPPTFTRSHQDDAHEPKEEERGEEQPTQREEHPSPAPAPEAPTPPPRDAEALARCDEAIRSAVLTENPNEEAPIMFARGARDGEEPPNQNSVYRTRTSPRAEQWRLEYHLHTGDCREAYYYGDVKFAQLDRPPRRSGRWNKHRNVLELPGVRVVITDEAIDRPHFEHAARECAEALTKTPGDAAD